MRLKQYLREDKAINNRKAQKWQGILYRAIDSKSKAAALGTGMYFTTSLDAAKSYGKDIRAFQTKTINILGVYSREFEQIKAYVNSDEGFDKWFDENSLAQMIRMEAEDRGYDAIYQDDTFGLVLFDPKKVKEIK
jgi:hypothetical protein